jgi:hypothetical protein
MYSKNYLKKIGSVALAGAMACSLSIPAFASTTTTPNTKTEITATYEDVPIAVTVPKTASATINPYGLPISVTLSDNSSVDIVNQQITTAPQSIKNDGKVGLVVGATVTTETKGEGVSLVEKTITTAGKNANTGKDIFVYLQLASVKDAKGDATAAKDAIQDAVIKACANNDTWGAYDSTAANTLALSGTTSVTKSGMVSLVPATITTNTDGDEVVTYNAGSVAAFRLAGSCVTSPTTAWATTDGFTAKIAFTFLPDTSITVPEEKSDSTDGQETDGQETDGQETDGQEQPANNG